MSYRKGLWRDEKKGELRKKASRCIWPRVAAEADANKLKNEDVWQVEVFCLKRKKNYSVYKWTVVDEQKGI
jgi:hypothetical protein